ncbi:MAG: MerR family transcriptional regulator [Propionibacteriaceae bacterium]|jgi:DNA-binding transcriptional MerR regulator|nr:MerR family transcriptional regulator [Propionibacteriaceae bacterium]
MAAAGLAIGKVLSLLKPEYPDVSISKIRFLESEGLITPQRAPSGFRRYSKADVERLRYILSAQKNNYLPLKVIRDNLELIDQGFEPTAPEPVEPPKDVPLEPLPEGQSPPVRLSREDLLRRSGLPEASLIELERQGIIRLRRGTSYYGWEALTLAIVAVKFAPLGIETRQLRVVKAAADREVELITMAVGPLITKARKGRSQQATLEIAEVVMQAHAALLQVGLDHV